MLRPLETLAGVVYAGLATCAITRAVEIYASYQLYALFANAETDGYGNPIGVDIAQAERMDMFQALIAVLLLLFLIGTGVPYLMWLWRATSNLAVLSKVKQKYEPSMAVAGWFIPFLNLVRPYQVVQELHDTSLSAAKDAGVRLDAAPVGPWWAAWLLTSIAGVCAGSLAGQVEDVESLNTAMVISMADSALAILTAVLCAIVVRRITGMQAAARAYHVDMPPAA